MVPRFSTVAFVCFQAWGHSTVVDPWGNILATCDHKPTVIVADVDLDEVLVLLPGVCFVALATRVNVNSSSLC